MRINTEIKCGFLVLDSGLLPVESNPRHSTYNRGGAAQPKVTVLTVMCQQDSRPEIQAGTLFAPPRAAALPPSCSWTLSPVLLLIKRRFLFCLSYTSQRGNQTRVSPRRRARCRMS